MKRLSQILQVLLGIVALIITSLVAFGRLTWRSFKGWWQKRAKWVRRSLAAIAILIPVAFVALLAYVRYDNEYGRRSWYDYRLSDQIIVHHFNDGKCRLYNYHTERYTTPRISWVKWGSESNDSIAVYAIPNKRGYINARTGEIIIDAKANNYQKAWVFSEGLAAVMKDDKVGFINAQNEVVIPFQFDYAETHGVFEMGYVFHGGMCIMTNKDGYVGLIDAAGNWVVEPIYDEVWTPNDNGYRIVIKDAKSGVLDAQGKVVYPAEYLSISILSDGVELTKGGKMWKEDFEGNVTQPFMFRSSSYINYPIGNNDDNEMVYALSDYVMYEVMNCYGIMNSLTGEPITLAIYSDINMLTKDMFEVQEYDSYNWYLIDTKGNVVSKE